MGIIFSLDDDTKTSIVPGVAFGLSSLGITTHILRAEKISNTLICELIITTTIIDDMIALVILC